MGLWSLCNHVPWSSVFLLTQMFGVRLRVIQEREVCSVLQKRVGWSTHLVNDKNCGYFCSFQFIGHIATTLNPMEAWIICSDETFKRLTAREARVESLGVCEPERETVEVYDRVGSYENPWFKKRRLSLNMEPRPEQEAIMTRILAVYAEKNKCVALIHGPAGNGKSMIALLLAAKMKTFFCNSLKPWQPGDSFSLICSEIEPSPERPLIVVFDEFDGPLLRMHENSIESHKKTPIAAQDKQGWNRMLDDLSRGLYPHVILILTTNKSPAYFDALDASYIRSGRVDVVSQLSNS